MPDGGDEGMRRDVKETELHQKLAVPISSQVSFHGALLMVRVYLRNHATNAIRWQMFVALSLGRLLYVLMEFCSEGPLTKYLGGHTDMAQRDNWVLDLARGLQHIHSSLVIHRDIKTDNLLVAIGSSGQKIIKYIDFGSLNSIARPKSMYFITFS